MNGFSLLDLCATALLLDLNSMEIGREGKLRRN